MLVERGGACPRHLAADAAAQGAGKTGGGRMTGLIPWRWDASTGALYPLTNRALGLEDGAVYRLEAAEERSLASHRHYFARIAELWASLPERLSGEPWAITPEFLRHYALIREGYCHATDYPCGSAAEARRWAGMLPRPKGERGEPVYSIRTVRGSVLTELVPETQKMLGNGGMGKARFQESKDAVLGFIEHLVGTKAGEAA